MTDDNGLIYMRARYYSPAMKRFINADIIAGAISNAITLNRYAYANGNPVSFIDPFGLWSLKSAWNKFTNWVEDKIVDPIVKTGKKVVNAVVKAANKVASVNKKQQEVNARIQQEQVKLIQNGIKTATDWVVDTYNDVKEEVQYERKEQKQEIKSEQSKNQISEYEIASDVIDATGYATDVLSPIGEKAMESAIRNSPRPNNIGRGTWAKQVDADIAYMNKGFEYAGYGMTSVFTILNTGMGVEQNIQNGESTGEIISDAAIDIGSGAVSITTTILLAKAGTVISPGWGTAIGLGVGLLYDFVIAPLLDAAFE